MVMGALYIGLIPAPLHPIIQLILLDCWGFLFIVMIELHIGLIPSTILHITMMGYTFSTQGSLKKIFQGLCKEKITKAVIKTVSFIRIKIILIIIIQVFHHTLIQALHHTLVQKFHHTLIQAYHHNLIVCFRIALLILFMHLM